MPRAIGCVRMRKAVSKLCVLVRERLCCFYLVRSVPDLWHEAHTSIVVTIFRRGLSVMQQSITIRAPFTPTRHAGLAECGSDHRALSGHLELACHESTGWHRSARMVGSARSLEPEHEIGCSESWSPSACSHPRCLRRPVAAGPEPSAQYASGMSRQQALAS